MKLVIDISEEDYRMIQDRVINDESWGLNLSDIDIEISKGKPLDAVLDKIKAEFKRKANSNDWYHTTDGLVWGEAIEIIDKHRKGESE